MGWVTAVASIAAAQQAGAVGKYNQAVQERNAVVAEQEKERLEQQLEFDLARFDDFLRRERFVLAGLMQITPHMN